MKKIIYRTKPVAKFNHYKSEDECQDLNFDEEFKKLTEEHPDWEIFIIKSTEYFNSDFIKK
jgi:hypothetical protein